MLSRSHILIEKELIGLTKQQPWGIQVAVINDNLYEWSAKIEGPLNSAWEGGEFRVYLKFDEHYNIRPPRVCFHTIPYHPNIDMITGRPCIDYLDDYEMWDETVSISSLLVQIQNLLCNPVLEQAVNTEAASMISNSPEAYVKIAKECVEYSRLLAGGEVLNPDARKYSLQRPVKVESRSSDTQAGSKERKTTKLSFDDYFTQWSGLATTKPVPNAVNTYLESIKNDRLLKKIHNGMTVEEVEEENYNKHVEYDNMYYGTLNNVKEKEVVKGAKESNAKLNRINQMRKIYLPKKPLPTPRSPNRPHSDSDGEAENLVAWTQNLNTEDLDVL